MRIDCQNLFIFGFGGGEFFLPLVQQSGREMRLRIFRCELGCPAVSLQRVFRLAVFNQMRQCEPGASLTFFDISRRLEGCGSAQELLGIRIIGADKHQPQVKVRFKNVRLGRHRLAIRRDGFLGTAQAIQHESEIEPCRVIVGIFGESCIQQSLRAGEIAFLDGIFRLRDVRRLRIDALLVMANRSLVLSKSAGGEDAGREDDEQHLFAHRAVHARAESLNSQRSWNPTLRKVREGWGTPCVATCILPVPMVYAVSVQDLL